MINTKWLQTFCTLADIGSFTDTAKQLHMTQSGVSQHINKLEQAIGQALLIRQGKRFILTDIGERLRQQSTDLIAQLQSLAVNVSLDCPYEGEVRVMSPGSIGLKLYPHFLALQAQYPQLVIDYRFAPNDSIDQALLNNQIDIGFKTCPDAMTELSNVKIAEEALLLVTPAELSQPDWLSLQKLGFIDHPDGAYQAQQLLSANYPQFQHVNKLPKRGFSNQVSLLLEPVSLGLGFTVLPAHAVQAFAKPEKIAVHHLPIAVSEPIHIVELRDKPRPKRIHTIVEEALLRFSQCEAYACTD
ncbi:LysR family transcriptional regulator [Idiomarina xiamenensis]|uniref:LysR family transcriptional regulator n=1 Tax=Idiomarina xiamenensis 10-D-4 TaxID=740709 RepID=K2JMN1_9GAMM|nr:LysR family transcriptional regulator [Idiomarina xiamenensis]EKE84781.1 LysR family transcriptional regulator [Idiomarina xiamenensis 10-D-4]